MHENGEFRLRIILPIFNAFRRNKFALAGYYQRLRLERF